MPITYTSQEQVEVYRFSAPAAVLIPLVALFLQAFVPLRLHFFSVFDLPLLVVIFFAVARRSQVSGLLTGQQLGFFRTLSPISRSAFMGLPRPLSASAHRLWE